MPKGKHLAVLLRVEYETLRKWTTGETRPNRTKATEVAAALGITVALLMHADGASLPPDALAIAEAFDALLDQTDEQSQARDWAYVSIMGQLTAMRGGLGGGPSQAPADQPMPAPRPGKKIRL